MTTRSERHSGSCHCGAVRFTVVADLAEGGARCNCSICTKLGAFGKIVKPEAFELVAGEGALATYEWGAKISKRHFCKHCGVFCFGNGFLAEVGGAFVSVNLNCVDDANLHDLPTVHWDGRHDNWQSGPRREPYPIFA
ncbi:MAG TPA: GFA family protein [Polyangiaceae bacterium]|nr:GFA family protein [Polyangiaceae bacterium]